MKVIERLKEVDFLNQSISETDLLELIKESRFKNRKVKYLLELKKSFDVFYLFFMPILTSQIDPRDKRKYLVGGIKGIGFKAASHLLRDLGEEDLAIIDTHILKYLGIQDKKFNYIDVEDELRSRAKSMNISIAVLDAIVWSRYAEVSEEQFIY